MPTIDLTDDEYAAVTAAIRRAVEDDRFPRAPRLDPLRAALARFDAAKRTDLVQLRRGWKKPRPSQPRRPRRQPKPTSGRGDNRRPAPGDRGQGCKLAAAGGLERPLVRQAPERIAV